MKIAGLCGAVGLALAINACQGQEEPLTWEEFQAQATVLDDGVYVVDGDTPAENLDQLHAIYEAYLDSVSSEDGIGTIQQGLIVNRVGGRDDKWSASDALNLAFCVAAPGTDAGFSSSEFNAVVSAMNNASAAWEGAAHVNFTHVAAEDNRCARNNTSVVFNVRRQCTGQFLASSFFPSSRRSSRQLRIDCTSFGNISPWTLTGILRHELGHTLGFRHEHTRPQAGGVCFEDNNWRALTTYDSSSVMHYPQCNGTQTGDLVLTTRDRQGVASLYGSP